MGRTQAAYGPSFDHSRSFDRFTTRDVFDDRGAYRVPYADAAGACAVLPSTTTASAPRQGEEENAHETDEEVILWDLWYQLPKEDQVRFGNCFSRMILKILKRSDGAHSEDGIW
jgi:hypothetical protein